MCKPALRLLLICLALPSLLTAVDLEQGELNLSSWTRSFSLSYPGGGDHSYESIFHFDISQVVSNTGRFSARLDALHSDVGNRFSQLYLDWDRMKLGRFQMHSRLGDRYLRFTNLQSRFVNTYHPYLYFRGASLDLTGEKFDTTLWLGRSARLGGLLGSTYDLSGRDMLGIRSRFKSGRRLIVGAGYVHAGGELDGNEQDPISSNDILLLDSEFQAAPWLTLLGEVRHSRWKAEEGGDPRRGSFFKLGPVVKTERFELEANFRRVSDRFRFINRAAEVERDELGVFGSLRYRSGRFLSLFASLDRYRDNVDGDPGRNTTEFTRLYSGFTYYRPKFPNLTLRFDLGNRRSRRDLPDGFDGRMTGFYTQISHRMGKALPYLRFRYQRTGDHRTPDRELTLSTAYLGFRYALRRSSSLWGEGELDRRFGADRRETMRRINFRAGIRHHFTRRISLYAEAFYRRNGIGSVRHRFELYSSLSWELPRAVSLSLDIRTSRPIGQSGLGRTHWITLKINKRLKWGAPARVLGQRASGQDIQMTGVIEGYVFEDRNHDGALGAGDVRLPGLRIKLEDGSSIVTGDDGKFRFAPVAEGRHSVSLVENRVPAAYYIVSPLDQDVEVTARKTRRVDFLLVSGASLSGTVFRDTNRNRKRDEGEKGLKDVLILLEPVTPPGGHAEARFQRETVLNTYTDAEGRFSFQNIFPGEYRIALDKASLPKREGDVPPRPQTIRLSPGRDVPGLIIAVEPRPIVIKKKKSGCPG